MLVLASASPRRHALLRQIGLPFLASPVEVDESLPTGASPADAARAVARRKLEVAASRAGRGAFVLAMDTLGDLDGTPLGKPRDAGEARHVLRRLGGRAHLVHTALAVACPDGTVVEDLATTRVVFAPLGNRQIDAYVATGEPMGKAASYAIQGRAAAFVVEVDGDPTNVVGLPVGATLRLLARAGFGLPPHLAAGDSAPADDQGEFG